MRLLQLEPTTRKWLIQDFSGPTTPFYAILSHTWRSDDEEIKFEDIQDGSRSFDDASKPGYEKLRFCHDQAEKNGLRYFWIDTCCIKKTDSAELARSLNSMFYWYQRAAICYVYLSDISVDDTTDTPGVFKWEKAISKSRWFRRGWTLQELIAPSSVAFFTRERRFIGNKNEENFAKVIANVTQLPTPVLRGEKLSRFSVETRLSWAARRETTVPEDLAYCLIGIFDVQLPMLYAEGEHGKRKKAALAELDRAIKNLSIDDTEDAIRIAGASWSDLSRLGQRQVARLDVDLDGYQEWLLNEAPVEHKILEEKLPEFSQAAGQRMKGLLAKYGVRYDDLSSFEADVKSWQGLWNHSKDKGLSNQARVRALLQNRWYNAEKHENIYTCITAVKTLEELMIWRGRWTK